jgi:hypothetical protein
MILWALQLRGKNALATGPARALGAALRTVGLQLRPAAAQGMVVGRLPSCDNVHGNCAAMIDMMTRERARRLCGG